MEEGGQEVLLGHVLGGSRWRGREWMSGLSTSVLGIKAFMFIIYFNLTTIVSHRVIFSPIYGRENSP